jgi:hypothetical protein
MHGLGLYRLEPFLAIGGHLYVGNAEILQTTTNQKTAGELIIDDEYAQR